MRNIVYAAAVVLLSSAPAIAADDAMAGLYGNTIVVTGDAFQAHAHYRANHTLDISGTASGQAFSTTGSWKIDDKGQICRSYKKTVPTMANPLCTPAAAHKVGDTWTATSIAGGSRNVTLVAGIQ